MPLDANGIHQYVGSELAAPADQMLNRLASSTSVEVGKLRASSPRSYASAAARTAAIPAPVEGMLTWLQDVNRLEVYDGSAWLTLTTSTPFVVPCSLASLWMPGNGYSPPRLSRVAGRWLLSAAWQNAAAGTFSVGYADLLTLPAAARVPGMAPFQVNATWVGFTGVTASSAIQVDPVSGLVRWYLPGTATGVGVGAIGGATAFTWDAAPSATTRPTPPEPAPTPNPLPA